MILLLLIVNLLIMSKKRIPKLRLDTACVCEYGAYCFYVWAFGCKMIVFDSCSSLAADRLMEWLRMKGHNAKITPLESLDFDHCLYGHKLRSQLDNFYDHAVDLGL